MELSKNISKNINLLVSASAKARGSNTATLRVTTMGDEVEKGLGAGIRLEVRLVARQTDAGRSLVP